MQKHDGKRSMRLISWNINRRVGDTIGAQVKALCSRKPDIIALQEVTVNTASTLCEKFKAEGFGFVEESFSPSKNKNRNHGGRQYGELIASRWGFEQIASTEFDMPWPEKVLSVLVDTQWGKIEINTVHVPNGSNHGKKKIETFEAIYKRLAISRRCHRILCGDFNTPQTETVEGRIITWGQCKNAEGTFVIGKKLWDGISDERWDLAERGILEGLSRYDLRDLFREIQGYRSRKARNAFSFYNNHGDRFNRRFDHIFASSSLNGVKCDYLHLRQFRKLSDHAPIEAVFQPNRL